ncbi:hypothetical protein [Bradyrhizobium canariense]|uniref:hypothetical protein n=1 Tax=Bradyrhizobium canariense TaxID=255045 RepID=UPI0011783BFD|nr:hypothetical protein [Bradyrhizobium canariense]
MAGQEYFNRQAATLLKYAKAVADPEVAAGLVEKAADLKEQAERPRDLATTPVTRRPTPPADSRFGLVGNGAVSDRSRSHSGGRG